MELFCTVFVIGVAWTTARWTCKLVGVAALSALDRIAK